MPIDFSCPECQRHYRVKDELAGKGAKCGKCGHRMQIPAPSAAPVSSKAPAASKPPASTKAASSPKPQPAAVGAKTQQPAAASGAASNSWLDEELEMASPAMAPAAPKSAASCPSCGASLAPKAVLCVSCGYDTRTRSKLETRHIIETADTEKARPNQRAELSGAASLLRGTVFSFIAAVVGAAIWAGLAVLTEHEFGLVAWGLGGLVGFGMALGHEDDDGTFAGIIAAFMSLFGILAAKILIVVMVIAPMLAALADVEDVQVDPVELQREWVAETIAEQKLEKDGVDLENVTDEQWDQAIEAASAEVAGLSEVELNTRAELLEQEGEDPEEGAQAVAAQDAAAPAVDVAAPAIDDAAPEEMPADGLLALFFATMFSPIDGIFILLAFFTAYKVGSGTAGD